MNKTGDTKHPNVYALYMEPDAIAALDAQARRSMRSRSAQVRWLVEQEEQRLRAQVRTIPTVSEWTQEYPEKAE